MTDQSGQLETAVFQSLDANLSEIDSPGRVWIAYSGGIDSTVLMTVLARWTRRQEFGCTAVHVDHGLQAESQEWAEHAERGATSLGHKIQLLCVTVEASDGGPESDAREARYTAIQQLMAPNDVLLTAHHADDQAETLLLNLMRGSGPKGLRAMRPLRPFGAGWLVRPMLAIPRAEIEDWAARHALKWRDDPDNSNLQRDRNYVRHKVMPLLNERWPDSVAALGRSADWCRQASSLLDARLNPVLASLRTGERRVDVSQLRLRSKAEQRWLVREMAERLDLPPPPWRKVERVLDEALIARVDGEPVVRWRGSEVRRYRSELYFLAALPRPPTDALHWDGTRPIVLPRQLGELVLEGTSNSPASLSAEVRWYAGGERLHLEGRPRKRLKKVFQEAGVPPWIRRRLPLIFVDDELWWAGDRWQSAACLAWMRDHKMRFQWQKKAPFFDE